METAAHVLDGLVDEPTLAKQLNKSERTLQMWRRSRGLPYVRNGKTPLYDIARVRDWLARQAVEHASARG